jgi:hypothetical protein
VRGIIINKVEPAKLDMLTHYMTIAAKQLGTPLLGVVPHAAGFDSPSCVDLEGLFGEKMISRRDFALRRFDSYELVSGCSCITNCLMIKVLVSFHVSRLGMHSTCHVRCGYTSAC